MIWVLLITLMIKLISGPEQIFTVPKLEKEIKTHVTDEQRKDSLLLIIKETKKEIKEFNKENDKDKKRMKKLMASNDNEIKNIEILLRDAFDNRKKLQSNNLDNRIIMQELMTDEEWTNVIEKAISPTEKAERKTDKKEDKFDKYIDEMMADIKKSISKKIIDSLRKENALKAFNDFSIALKEHVKDGMKVDYQNNEIVGKRTATREHLEGAYANQNEFRKKVYDDFIELYKVIFEYTNKSERRAIRSELKKIFK